MFKLTFFITLVLTKPLASQNQDPQKCRFLYHLKRAEIAATQLHDSTLQDKLTLSFDDIQYLSFYSGVNTDSCGSAAQSVSSWKKWYSIANGETLPTPIDPLSDELECMISGFISDVNQLLARLAFRCETQGVSNDSCLVELGYLWDDGGTLAAITGIGDEVIDRYSLSDALKHLELWHSWLAIHRGKLQWRTNIITVK